MSISRWRFTWTLPAVANGGLPGEELYGLYVCGLHAVIVL